MKSSTNLQSISKNSTFPALLRRSNTQQN